MIRHVNTPKHYLHYIKYKQQILAKRIVSYGRSSQTPYLSALSILTLTVTTFSFVLSVPYVFATWKCVDRIIKYVVSVKHNSFFLMSVIPVVYIEHKVTFYAQNISVITQLYCITKKSTTTACFGYF